MNVLMIKRLILRDSTVSEGLELGFGRVLEFVCANWPARIDTSPISVLSRYQSYLGTRAGSGSSFATRSELWQPIVCSEDKSASRRARRPIRRRSLRATSGSTQPILVLDTSRVIPGPIVHR